MNAKNPITNFQSSIFTERELQVVHLLLGGKSNKQIALQLGIATRSVEVHLTSIYQKLNVGSRAEAIVKLLHMSDK